MDRPCTILHISDLHFGSAHCFEQKSVPEALRDAHPTMSYAFEKRLRELASSDTFRLPDLVICTGDYICAWDKDDKVDIHELYFTHALQFFNHLLHVINELREMDRQAYPDLLKPENFLLIPGNHDVLRGNPIVSNNNNYWSFAKTFYSRETLERITFRTQIDTPGSKESFSFVISTPGDTHPLAIVGVDSNELQDYKHKEFWESTIRAFDAQGIPRNRDKRIADYWPGWINETALLNALNGAKKRYPDATLAVAMHHPLLGRFKKIDEPDYRPILNADGILDMLGEYDVAFVLNGHKHFPDLFSIHHRGEHVPTGWHLANVQAGSMLKSHAFQPEGVLPSFNIVTIQIPIQGPVIHIETDIHEYSVDSRRFSLSSQSPYYLRIETKDAYSERITSFPPKDTTEGQADLRLMHEMDFVRDLRTPQIITDVTVQQYVDELLKMSKATESFIWMTCCVTPDYLMGKSSKTLPALTCFNNLATERDIRRLVILKKSDYVTASNKDQSLRWFWDNAMGNPSIHLLLTQKEWLDELHSDLLSSPIDLVLFGGTGASLLDRIENSVVIAYLATGYNGKFLERSHMIIGGANISKIDSNAARKIASFFTTCGKSHTSKSELLNRFIPCWEQEAFKECIDDLLVKPSPPPIKISNDLWEACPWNMD